MEELLVRVTIKETETSLKEKLQELGVDTSVFVEENSIWSCHACSNEQGRVALAFDEGEVLTFVDESAAADFLYVLICQAQFMQMMTVDFGGLLSILGDSTWEKAICCCDWEEREQVPFWTSVLCSNVLPDEDDPEKSMAYMDECDEQLMERFAEDSQIMMIFGETDTKIHRRLFWLEA